MKELILVRGLPGAGKSTLCRILSQGRFPVFSVDDYFTDPVTGKYTFQFDRNHLAYGQCEKNVSEAMKKDEPVILCDNTFTLQWEMEIYFKLADQFRYRVHVLTVENHHGGENTHGISDEQLQKMAAKYKVKLIP